MRATLDDPAIPALVQRLGMMNDRRRTHTKPDACSARNAPAFCGTI